MDKEYRLKRLRNSIRARGLDAALIFGPENRFYFSGFFAEDLGCTESSGCLLITRDENLLLTDGRYREEAEKTASGFKVIIYKTGLIPLLKRLFRKRGLKRCALEGGYISYERARAIKKALSHVKWQDLKDLPERMRAIKDDGEIARIKASQRANEAVFEKVLKELGPGLTEKEVAFMILKGLYEMADGPSFPPIVASGPNSSLPHAVPTDRRIEEGEPVIIDMGARLDGYCSDMTRTIFLGRPREEFKGIYRIVKRAQDVAQRGIRAGISAKKADELSRKVIEGEGLGEYFMHSLGHGVGIAIHEAPALSKKNRKILRPGMVITIEPGIYIPGKGGVRLENMAIVTEKGVKIITSKKWYYEF